MPKLTNKGLARKALKSIEPEGEAKQVTPKEAAMEQQFGASSSKIGQEIKKAEALLASHPDDPTMKNNAKDTSRFVPVGGQRLLPDISDVHKTSIDKHVESMRFKIVWVANKLADELIHETSKKTKKDKEYIKGLVWSFGTMYDKLANISTDTVQVHIPTKLLEGVKSAISIQIARVQQLSSSPDVAIRNPSVIATSPSDNHVEVRPPIDVTPTQDNVNKQSSVQLFTEDCVRSTMQGEDANDNSAGVST
ncbi:MAG: hypothetical protein ACRCZI_06645 [Cetobacterium sp.]